MNWAGMIKKFFMKHLWRFQQSQALISIIFWSMALAGIFYERSGWYFENYFGLSSDPDKQVGTKMLILFSLVLLIVVIFGILYDTILRLWEEKNIIMMERNPYAQYKLNVRDLLLYKNLHIPVLKSVNDGRFDNELAFMEQWIEKNIDSDAIARMYIDHITEWVNSDREKWVGPSVSKLMAASKENIHGKVKDNPEE